MRRFLGFLAAVLLASGDPPAAGAAVPAGFEDQLVLGSLTQPVALAFLPDGRLLFLEQTTGKIRLVVEGVLSAAPVLTVPDLNTNGGERGLLGFAVDPEWPHRPFMFVYYTRLPEGTMVISRYTASGDLNDGASANLTLTDRYDLLNDIPDVSRIHNAGTLRFGPDGMLYASVGEDAAFCFAQDSTDFRGSILRLDVSALPDTGAGPPPKSLLTPPDNPFPPQDPELGLVYCFGLRNPFRFQIDPFTGHLFVADVGSNYFEELNEATGGENFGWPYREGPTVIVPPGCPEPGGSGSLAFDGWIAGYDRSSMASASIVTAPRYRRVAGGAYSFPPEYQGVLFFSDYYGGFIRAIRNFGGVWSALEPVPGQPDTVHWATGTTGIVDYAIGPDGALYYARLFPGSIRRLVYTGSVSAVDPAPVPGEFRMQAVPNPFRGSGMILVPRAAAGERVVVRILDLGGGVVRDLEGLGGDGGARIVWDGRDARGATVPSGVYYAAARVSAGGAAVKIVLVR